MNVPQTACSVQMPDTSQTIPQGSAYETSRNSKATVLRKGISIHLEGYRKGGSKRALKTLQG